MKNKGKTLELYYDEDVSYGKSGVSSVLKKAKMKGKNTYKKYKNAVRKGY